MITASADVWWVPPWAAVRVVKGVRTVDAVPQSTGGFMAGVTFSASDYLIREKALWSRVRAGEMTINQARARLNMGPVDMVDPSTVEIRAEGIRQRWADGRIV